MNIDSLYEIFLQHPKVSTDSRDIPENGLFFALKGPNFNGNAYAAEALSKGAAYAVVDEAEFATGPRTLLVPDVLSTLQHLARHHRRNSPARIVSLTGSNGKTTTKELIAAVLGSHYNILATRGNLNNHIGVPLTLLRIQPETEYAIVEMGANHQGEIAALCEIAEPDFGYITNFGKAHLEGFGGVQGVIKGKSELYRFIRGAGGTLFMNADDPIQSEKLSDYVHKVGFSTTDTMYFLIENLGADPEVSLRFEEIEIHSQINGGYNFSNCAAAVTMGKYFNVPPLKIKAAIEAYVPENNRSQIIRQGDLEIILDAYNANPSSMKVALESFDSRKAQRKIAILGDMFELGEDAPEEHRAIGQQAMDLNLDQLYLVGENFADTDLDAPRFRDFAALAAALQANPIAGPASVLIKGSRGMALERVLGLLSE
ncbi:UDP-N-acetylmuramoyl-tripeptide--D-alanyl-D-alanine ligase [Robiginitalea myxolifaciens]|uniref:UDP-N-acetylmuramoyl-tripeptide--D-alanyl-D-alanine ligase n=1 Tax=Robiginitalea myxolifaciens TaxID=400055 RepID=A0A1I6HJ99_9FLAO|nr:UDP-N-acetylmuramoyl-tripeptide--D-alanyl-D-alanine ligase [Robiginitalea myxolifaciens]SFR54531.1 UDP-N-acetylmuramoyl-tripeptide--D-alanyl-D-alanine ligase [Robiginitalea myxolifaciens]